MENESANELRRQFTQPQQKDFMMPRQFLEQLFSDERDNIRNALAMVREDNPKFYLRTMIEIGKTIVPKMGSIRHDLVNHDMDELSALARSCDSPTKVIDVDNSSYIEELTPWENAQGEKVHPDVLDTSDEIMSSLPSPDDKES